MLTNCLRFKVRMNFSFSCSTRPVMKELEEEPVNLEKTADKHKPIDVELEEIAFLMKTGDVPNENKDDN